jgi:molybdopterin/thiamine biosynthesis adenylyltransferase
VNATPVNERSGVFDYDTAFLRNRGFVSEPAQARLREARVAVAGLGGTGSAQVHALARLGIGGFNIADPDVFELVNFNRQSGATVQTLGRRKTDVASEQIRGINPEADVRQFDEGIGPDNVAEFLAGADVVVDSLDFYCFAQRFVLYQAARSRGLWVLTAPPLGFGFTLLMFDPRGMTYEDYFGFEPGMSEREQVVALIAGIAPRPFLLRYLAGDGADLGGRRLPSIGAAPFMIAGVIATEVAALVTGIGARFAVPRVYQFDALLRKFRRGFYPLGMRSPWQRVKRALIARRFPR